MDSREQWQRITSEIVGHGGKQHLPIVHSGYKGIGDGRGEHHTPLCAERQSLTRFARGTSKRLFCQSTKARLNRFLWGKSK